MKKLYLLFAVLIVMAVVIGCASAPAAAPTPAPAPQAAPAAPAPQQSQQQAVIPAQQPQAAAATSPPWLNELPPNEAFWGIGIARLQNDSLALETATTRAQRDVGRQLSVLVQGMLIDYANESGLANNPRSIQSIENIGRNLVNVNISGASPNARTRMNDGTWWVRVAVRNADAQRAITSIVNHEMADFAEFRADQALRRLDFELNRTPSRPEPRSVD